MNILYNQKPKPKTAANNQYLFEKCLSEIAKSHGPAISDLIKDFASEYKKPTIFSTGSLEEFNYHEFSFRGRVKIIIVSALSEEDVSDVQKMIDGDTKAYSPEATDAYLEGTRLVSFYEKLKALKAPEGFSKTIYGATNGELDWLDEFIPKEDKFIGAYLTVDKLIVTLIRYESLENYNPI